MDHALAAAGWSPEAISAAMSALGTQQNAALAQTAGYGVYGHQPQVILPPSSPFHGQTVPTSGKGKGHQRMPTQEEMLSRQMELKAKREEEGKVRDQHRAALKVRKIIQKVRAAKTDTIDDARAELDAVMTEQIMFMGPLAQKVQEEADKACLESQQKIAEEAERLIEEQRKEFEEEMARREEEARIEALADEALNEVIEVESKVAQAEELVKPFTEDLSSLADQPEGILEATVVAQEAIDSAQAELNHCSSGIREKWSTRGGGDTSATMQQTLAPQFRQLHQRLSGSRRTLDRLRKVTAETKGKVEREALQRKKDREQKELWAKYSNLDGNMYRSEVKTFAEIEYEFELTDKQLDTLFKRPSRNGEDCLPYEKFAQITTGISNMKNQAVAKQRKEEEARERQEFEEKKSSVKKLAKELNESLQAAEASAEQARNLLRDLQKKGAGSLSSSRLVEISGEVDSTLEKARQQLTDANDKLLVAEEEPLSEDSFGRYRKQELDRLRGYHARILAQLEKADTAAESGREQARIKEVTEIGGFRTRAIIALRTQMTTAGESAEQMFSRICDGELELDAFAALLRSLPDLTVEDGHIEGLFELLADSSSSISSETFIEFTRLFYKVNKSTLLTATMIVNSKVNRKLDAGEIVELVEGPQKDEKVGILRVHCRSVIKGDDGWVSLSGNQGTVFLEPCGMFYLCAKDVSMTNGLSEKQSMTMRQLTKGELLEAVGVPTLDDSSGITRIECKAKSDSMIGFVTMATRGAIYLEPC